MNNQQYLHIVAEMVKLVTQSIRFENDFIGFILKKKYAAFKFIFLVFKKFELKLSLFHQKKIEMLYIYKNPLGRLNADCFKFSCKAFSFYSRMIVYRELCTSKPKVAQNIKPINLLFVFSVWKLASKLYPHYHFWPKNKDA